MKIGLPRWNPQPFLDRYVDQGQNAHVATLSMSLIHIVGSKRNISEDLLMRTRRGWTSKNRFNCTPVTSTEEDMKEIYKKDLT